MYRRQGVHIGASVRIRDSYPNPIYHGLTGTVRYFIGGMAVVKTNDADLMVSEDHLEPR